MGMGAAASCAGMFLHISKFLITLFLSCILPIHSMVHIYVHNAAHGKIRLDANERARPHLLYLPFSLCSCGHSNLDDLWLSFVY